MRWLAVLTLVVVVAGAAWAQPDLQPPTPSGGEIKQPPKQISSDDQSKAAPDQRGTEEKPLVTKIIMPAKTQTEAAQDAEDREEKTSSDRWMVGLTGAIVFVGVVQTVVFGIQARRLKETVLAMKQIDEGQSAKVAESIAQATRAANAMKEVADAMSKQATLAHQSYLATHRPRLRVRFIDCGEPKPNDRPGAVIRIANVGYTDAKIVSIGADIFRRTGGRTIPGGWSAIPQTVPLNPIAEPSQELLFTVMGGSAVSENNVRRILLGEDELCLLGIVIYEDYNGTKRTTSFFRIYDRALVRYRRAKEDDFQADYEYEN
jgi:hypothetical protein